MSIGYPDYGRQAVQAPSPVIYVTNTITTPYYSELFYLGDYRYLNVFLFHAELVDHYDIQFAWYPTASKTYLAGMSHVTTMPAVQSNLQVPVLGQWCQITITPAAGTDTGGFLGVFSATNAEYSQAQTAQTVAPLLHYDATVNANSSVTQLANYLYRGQATLSLWHASNSSWFATIRYWDFFSKAWVPFIHINGGDYGRGLMQRISIPPAPIEAFLQNQDTVADEMFCAITPD